MKVRDFVSLTKPKIAALVLTTAITGYLMASGPSLDLSKFLTFLLLSYLVVGGCGALNMYLDKEIDAIMPRTRSRPIPSGRIGPLIAIVTGVSMIVVGIAGAALTINWLTSLMMTMGVIFYIVVYTIWLKRRTPWNIVIGGAAGSFAPLGGYAAVTGSITIEPILLGILIFAWTPGHFWSLAIRAKDQYREAGIPMLPVVLGIEASGRIAALSNVALLPLSLSFVAFGTGLWFVIAAFLANVWLTYESIRLYLEPSGDNAWRVFKSSSPYLFLLCTGLILDSLLGG